MANTVFMVRRLQRLLQDWWGVMNACEVTGAHGTGPRAPGGLASAVISYRDWPSSGRPGQH